METHIQPTNPGPLLPFYDSTGGVKIDSAISVPLERYLRINLHKHCVVIGGISPTRKQRPVHAPVRAPATSAPEASENLTHFTYGGTPRRMASVEEVLALKPELCRAD